MWLYNDTQQSFNNYAAMLCVFQCFSFQDKERVRARVAEQEEGEGSKACVGICYYNKVRPKIFMMIKY